MSEVTAPSQSHQNILLLDSPDRGTIIRPAGFQGGPEGGLAGAKLHKFLCGMRAAARLIDDLHGLSQFTVDLVLRELSSTRGSLMLVDDRQILRILAARGVPESVMKNTFIRVGDGVAGRVVSCGRPLRVETVETAPTPLGMGRYRCQTFLSVPLPAERRILGVVNVTEPLNAGPFQDHHLEQLVNIADSVGLAIHRAMCYREAKELALRDELTGLYNRRYLWDFLETILGRSQQEGFPVTLLMFDIDHFKDYNDQYGHPAGDRALCEVANLMRDNFRTHDVICRFGGEEFAVVLWDGRGSGVDWASYPSTVLGFAERLRHATMHHQFGTLHHTGLTLSGGLATFPWDASTRAELVEQADNALYRAKRDGRNRVYLCG